MKKAEVENLLQEMYIPVLRFEEVQLSREMQAAYVAVVDGACSLYLYCGCGTRPSAVHGGFVLF